MESYDKLMVQYERLINQKENYEKKLAILDDKLSQVQKNIDECKNQRKLDIFNSMFVDVESEKIDILLNALSTNREKFDIAFKDLLTTLSDIKSADEEA